MDDDGELRALLRDFLESDGLRVQEAREAGEALAALERCTPTVVVLDRRMPGMDGLDFLAYVHAHHPSVPVIFMTAFGGPAVAAEALRRGAARYIEKPFRVAEMLRTVSSLLGPGGTDE